MVICCFGFNLSCDRKSPNECREYYARPSYEREQAFRTYSLKKQLNIYRCATRRRPPELGLASYIAEAGGKAIPVLLDRLKTEKDESTQADMIYIFELMADKGHLRGRLDVIEQIKHVIGSMRYSITKTEAQKTLDNIIRKSLG
jgi:hypothetical protein